MEQIACIGPHCWHWVGYHDVQHGPFAPEPIVSKSVMGCCHCGSLETVDGIPVDIAKVRFHCEETARRFVA